MIQKVSYRPRYDNLDLLRPRQVGSPCGQSPTAPATLGPIAAHIPFARASLSGLSPRPQAMNGLGSPDRSPRIDLPQLEVVALVSDFERRGVHLFRRQF